MRFALCGLTRSPRMLTRVHNLAELRAVPVKSQPMNASELRSALRIAAPVLAR